MSGTAEPPDARALHARLCGYLSESELAAVRTMADRLARTAGGVDRLPSCRVMVAYGGGKDSTYVVAFVRAVQLHLRLVTGRSFALRVVNMRHAGVTRAVMHTIDRVYRRLGLLDDAQAELLTVDHGEIRPFHRDLPLPERLLRINRLDVLMNGHRTAGDGRPTFCNSCNFAVADLYGRAAWWRGGVDVVITGDSRREQALYAAWIMRLARDVGVDVSRCRDQGFRGVLSAVSGISQAYFRDLYGDDADAERRERAVSAGHPGVDPEFLSIYDLVSYRIEDHWDLIVDHLGFAFDDLAFSFTESDCANPSLMAHLRGLRAEYVEGRSYHDGVAEYLTLAEFLMRAKQIPASLIHLVLSRYDSAEKATDRRRLVAGFAREAFGLDEEALVAMVFSPFTDEGRRLGDFVARCHPARLPDLPALHQILRSGTGAEDLVHWLERVSGLPVAHLRTLYTAALVDFARGDSVIAQVRSGDPHKLAVPTTDPGTGRAVLTTISGR